MIVYRNASLKDMEQVSVVHEQCFPDYFLTLFGTDLLSKYYAEFLNENDLFIVACEGEEIIGFCMGYYGNSTARERFEINNKMAIIRKLLILCLSLNKLAIKKCFNRLINRKSADKKFIPDVDLLSICVLPDYRGTGVSKEMVELFERRCLNSGHKISNCTLSVISNNTRARNFYEGIGYQILEEKDNEIKYIKYFN